MIRVQNLEGMYDLSDLSNQVSNAGLDNPLAIFEGRNVDVNADSSSYNSYQQFSFSGNGVQSDFSFGNGTFDDTVALKAPGDTLYFSDYGQNSFFSYDTFSASGQTYGGHAQSVQVEFLTETANMPVPGPAPMPSLGGGNAGLPYIPGDSFPWSEKTTAIDIVTTNQNWNGSSNPDGSSTYHNDMTVDDHLYALQSGPDGVTTVDSDHVTTTNYNESHYANGNTFSQTSEVDAANAHVAAHVAEFHLYT